MSLLEQIRVLLEDEMYLDIYEGGSDVVHEVFDRIKRLLDEAAASYPNLRDKKYYRVWHMPELGPDKLDVDAYLQALEDWRREVFGAGGDEEK